jgi:Cysteine-rich CPXCG
MVLDLSLSQDTYVEDCEVCCKPIKINYIAQGDSVVNFSASSLEE